MKRTRDHPVRVAKKRSTPGRFFAVTKDKPRGRKISSAPRSSVPNRSVRSNNSNKGFSRYSGIMTFVSLILVFVMFIGLLGNVGGLNVSGSSGGSSTVKPGGSDVEVPEETPGETPDDIIIPEATPSGYFAFAETQKAYPLYLSIDECVGFMEYYQSDDITFTFIPSEVPPIMSQSLRIVSSKNDGTVNVEMLIKDEQYGGEYQFINVEDAYDDFAFYINYMIEDCYYIILVGIKGEEKTVLLEDVFNVFPSSKNYPYEMIAIENLPEGYYIFNNK